MASKVGSVNFCFEFVIAGFHSLFHPLTISVPHQKETSQFICSANKLTGFYMMANTGR